MECPVEKWAHAAAARPALTWQGRTYTYHSLHILIEKKAAQFSSRVFYPVEDVDCITLLAIIRSGACILPINSRLPPTEKEAIQKEYGGKASPNNCATALMTSGTTSAPKLACHSNQNLLTSAASSFKALKMSMNSRTLLTLPLFHIAGIASLFRTFSCGGHLIIPSSKNLQQEIEAASITHLSLVPTQLLNIGTCTTPVTILLGGAPCPPHLLKHAQEQTVFHSYGMTETTAMILCNGQPLEGVETKITSDNRLLVKSNTLFQGYYRDGALEKPHLQDGYFDTHDLATAENDGTITILGRADRMFISGGENIQPGEIERAIESYPGIDKAVVKPTEDAKYGQIPIAFITPLLPEEQLKNFLIKTLPKYKIPKQFHPISDLGGKYGINFL